MRALDFKIGQDVVKQLSYSCLIIPLKRPEEAEFRSNKQSHSYGPSLS